ncbi:DUF1573 domain-containing protein [Flavobacterium pallidum]|uniref:DUF1573 domain-containing protein n=1 Tax=Flavobacterium pallidum TaxID=2172098 RepID=A0A2S1SIC5_9FLAO|nr:DUF1573 domain-containing protein [Flavobacterium pallidum]AWI26156.1 hypothetical protein HYN49_09740 [Flavobacterium pallidum]
MKKVLCLAAMAAFILTTSCKKENKDPNSEGKAIMEFKEKEFDFGDINEGDKVEHVFSFKNTGEVDLKIVSARGSCGCTVPDYPKEPVKPGEESQIKVSFNSARKHGEQHKTVTINANTATGTEVLKIKGNVIAKDTSGISAGNNKHETLKTN